LCEKYCKADIYSAFVIIPEYYPSILNSKHMFNKKVVFKALKKSLSSDSDTKLSPISSVSGEDGLISLLIHDVFGGEILKTHSKKYWHFYNRVNGERVDFTEVRENKIDDLSKFEDIPSTPDETYGYIDQADYTTFFTKFVSAFEDTIGLENLQPGMSS
jgi:hypothetical protein